MFLSYALYSMLKNLFVEVMWSSVFVTSSQFVFLSSFFRFWMFALLVSWMSIVFSFLLEGLFSIFRVIKWSEIEQGMMMPLWLFEVVRILSIVVEELFVILVYLCMNGSRLLFARIQAYLKSVEQSQCILLLLFLI